MDKNRTIYYANLNSFNSATGITDTHMRLFFERASEGFAGCVVDVIVDRYEDDVPLNKRTGWKKIIQACADGKVDCITVPSISMLTVAPGELSLLISDTKSDFNVHFYFILENIFTFKEEAMLALQFYFTLLQEYMQMRKKEEAMRIAFLEATGMSCYPSAKLVPVDREQYGKAEDLARKYGMTVRELVSELLTFATVPQNKVALEDHILGIDPPKSVRPDRPKE